MKKINEKNGEKLAASMGKLKESAEHKRQSKRVLNAIEQMIAAKGIDLAEIGNVNKVSIYQQVTKDAEGEFQVHDLQAIQFSPAWETGPQWELPKPGPSVQIQKSTVKPIHKTTAKTAVIVPDIQIGYFRNEDGELVPTHDERAIAIAMAMIRDIQPTQIVLLGDNLDLPEFGKYRLSPAFALTTQASIDRATTLCAEMREAAPKAKIVWLAGNHEERLTNYILDNAKAAFGITKGNTPKSWPDMSVPSLCRMEEYGIHFESGYPAGYYLINKQLACIHGTRVRSRGSTAHIYLNEQKLSVIYGHIHRIELAYRTRQDWDGARTIMAASPGTLARIDGAVPSTKGGVDAWGRPKTVIEDWQQGVGLVTYEDTGKNLFTYEVATIYDGWTRFRGTEYDGRNVKAPKLK